MVEANRASIVRLAREMGGYGLASLLGLAIDMTVLHLLVSVANVHYLVAATVSFVCGGAAVYLISVTFVFRFRRIDRRALELSYFVALGSAGLIVNAAVIYVAVSAAHVHYLVGKVLAAGCTFGVNYFLRRYFLFTPSISTPPVVS